MAAHSQTQIVLANGCWGGGTGRAKKAVGKELKLLFWHAV